MSAILWQDIAVTAIAAAALGWLVLRRVRARARKSDSACESCPSANPVPGVRPAPVPEVLLSIGDPPAGSAGPR